MSDERRLDAAIGLMGLGKVYPHIDHAGVCATCGKDIENKDKICYDLVPHYGEDIKAASELLSEIWKTAKVTITYNRTLDMFELYHAKNGKGNKFISKKAPEAIKDLALFHYNIEEKTVVEDCEKDCCVVNQA